MAIKFNWEMLKEHERIIEVNPHGSQALKQQVEIVKKYLVKVK